MSQGELEPCSVCGASLSGGVCSACGTKASTPNTPQQSSSQNSAVASLIGLEIQKQYRIIEKLGEGGFGAVYIAEEPRFARKVAIKTLHARLSHDPTLLERFRREGMAASRLEHPAAVKVFNLGQTDDGLVWMAMELIYGKTLAQVIEEKKSLSLEETRAFLKPLCEVLEEAHQKGIVHRDLKPQNIMLVGRKEKREKRKEEETGPSSSDPSGSDLFPLSSFLFPRLLDFGVAKLLSADTLTQTAAAVGTPAFMAPEQWEDSQSVDGRADIYALGLIAYRCLAGRLPFEAKTASAWMKKHCLEAPASLASLLEQNPLAPELSAVVMKSLEKNPDARYQTAMEFYRALEQVGVVPKPIEPPAPKQNTEQPVIKRNKPPYPWIALAAVLALLLLWRPWEKSAPAPQTPPLVSVPKETPKVQPPTKIQPATESNTITQSAPTSAILSALNDEPVAAPSGVSLQALITAGPNDLYIVGEVGTILHSTDSGASWRSEESPIRKTFYDGWWDGVDTVYLVGRNNALLQKKSNGPWEYVESGYNPTLHSIWGSSPEEIYVAGAGGFLMRYFDHNWDQIAVGGSSDLQDIFGDGRDIFIVGNSGTILKIQNGNTAVPLSSGVTENLYAIWGDGKALYAAGADSTFIVSTDQGQSWQRLSVQGAAREKDFMGLFGAEGVLYLLSEDSVYVGNPDNLKRYPFSSPMKGMAGLRGDKVFVLSDEDVYQSPASGEDWKKLHIVNKEP